MRKAKREKKKRMEEQRKKKEKWRRKKSGEERKKEEGRVKSKVTADESLNVCLITKMPLKTEF